MVVAVLCVSAGHMIIKILSVYSPYVTPYDITLFMGLFNFPMNLIIGIKSGVNMNIFTYEKAVLFLLFLRVTLG